LIDVILGLGHELQSNTAIYFIFILFYFKAVVFLCVVALAVVLAVPFVIAPAEVALLVIGVA
jgi:hypothetical protein